MTDGPAADRVAAIIGLGLIGGSLARDLAGRGVRVLGYDREPATVERAIRDGVITATIEADLANLSLADWVVLAVPVDAAPALLEAAAPQLERARLVTDVGSTKRSIEAAATRLGIEATFVGSHPLAGDHASGWEASRTGLFEGATVFLCPVPATDDAGPASAIDEARLLWSLCGAQPRLIDAAAHDRLLARTSHLPQLLSTALAALLAADGVPYHETGPGARGMLRLAGSSPDMWSAIVADNADNIDDVLAALEGSVYQLRQAVARGDTGAVRALLERGCGYAGG